MMIAGFLEMHTQPLDKHASSMGRVADEHHRVPPTPRNAATLAQVRMVGRPGLL